MYIHIYVYMYRYRYTHMCICIYIYIEREILCKIHSTLPYATMFVVYRMLHKSLSTSAWRHKGVLYSTMLCSMLLIVWVRSLCERVQNGDKPSPNVARDQRELYTSTDMRIIYIYIYICICFIYVFIYTCTRRQTERSRPWTVQDRPPNCTAGLAPWEGWAALMYRLVKGGPIRCAGKCLVKFRQHYGEILLKFQISSGKMC